MTTKGFKLSMLIFLEIQNNSNLIHPSKLQTLAPCTPLLPKYFHFNPNRNYNTSINPPLSPPKTILRSNVAIFWDLDNKPPKSFPPYEAAVRLKKVMEELGVVRYMLAYANHHAFSYIPPEVREQRRERKELNHLENKGIIKPVEPYFCRVCGRRFYNNDKLIHHFRTIHEREQTKRLNQIESAKGKKKVNLVAKFSMKMEKYKHASRDLLTPKVGYGLADELKRAGYWVKTVSDKPQAADVALRDQMIHMMDKKKADCLVLVSDDSDFVEVLKEAKMRCLKTVVVGDLNDGMLKRAADSAFSWSEIMRGKAKKEAVTVVGRWRDRDVLKRLEWTYDPERDRKLYGLDHEFDDETNEKDGDDLYKDDENVWWELGSDAHATS